VQIKRKIFIFNRNFTAMISRNLLFFIGALLVIAVALLGCKSKQKSVLSATDKSIPYKTYEYVLSTKNRGQSIGYDIELFKESVAWEAAKAVYKQDTEAIRNLCGKNPDIIKFKDSNLNFTLLQWAVFNRRYYSAKTLLEMGASPDEEDITGSTPLVEASSIEETSEYLKLMLKFGGNVNKIVRRQQISWNTPLAAAVTAGLKNVKILVNAGANVHDTESNHFSNACFSGHIKIVEYLIIDCKVDFRRPVMTADVHNKHICIYAYSLIAERNFPKTTPEYVIQQRLLSYLKEHGSDTTADLPRPSHIP
jgi:hypothetical protein